MDLGEMGENLLLLLMLVIFFVGGIFLFRKRKGGGTSLEMVVALLSEVSYNRKLMEDFHFHWNIKKFKVDSWNRDKSKLDFLDQPLQAALSDAFNLIEDFNQRIDAAKKNRTSSYLAGIDIEKLRTPLDKSWQGLQEWLKENLEKAGLPPRRGLFG